MTPNSSKSNYISKQGKSDHFTEEMMFTNFGSRGNAEDYGRKPKPKQKQAEDDKLSTYGSVLLDEPQPQLNAQERLE